MEIVMVSRRDVYIWQPMEHDINIDPCGDRVTMTACVVTDHKVLHVQL